MKLKIFALFLTVGASAVMGQTLNENPVVQQQTISLANTDGTNTVKKLNSKGDAIDILLLAPDGATKRRTMLIFDTEGKCLGWKSSNEKGCVDCGQFYVFHPNGVVTKIHSFDGEVVYQK